MYVDSFWEKKQTNKQTNEENTSKSVHKFALELFHNMGAVRSIVVTYLDIENISSSRSRTRDTFVTDYAAE